MLTNNLYGLVMAGGKSSRMQTDKGELQYHAAISQRSFTYELLSQFCEKTFISCRQNQVANLPVNQEYILDEDLYGGPANGILSAFHHFPNKAFLVIAVDLPHISVQTIQQLIEQRDPTKMATAYALQGSDKPEPLIAIWEPAALALAEQQVKAGINCPRKFLMTQDIKLIFPENDIELFNANFYAEYLEAKNRIATS